MKPTRFELILLIIAAGIITYHIFIPPLIGLADSGDFGRVIAWKGLWHTSTEYNEMYFHHFNSKYHFIPKLPGPEPYLTSTSLLITPAIWLSIAIGQNQVFDIRILGAIYTLLFLFGIWLVLISMRSLHIIPRIITSALIIVVLTDVGHIAYFNSFYSEGTALVFLIIGLGCGLILIARESSSAMFLIGYFLAIGMMVISKPMYLSLVPAFLAFGFYLSGYIRYARRLWLAGGLAFVLCSAAFWYYKQTPPYLTEQSVYIGIFMDMLPNSTTPREDLAELGLNPDYAVFSRSTPYQDDSPLRVNSQFQDEFSRKARSYTLPLFYLTHPDRLYDLCARCMRNAFTTRVDRLGYYEAHTGKPPFAKPFGVWSSLRENLFPRSVYFLAIFFATAIAAAVLFIKSSSLRPMFLLYLLFIFIAAMQFFVAVTVGGGEPDVGKHLYMFNLAFDLSFVLLELGAYHLVKTYRPVFLNRRGASKSIPADDKPAHQD